MWLDFTTSADKCNPSRNMMAIFKYRTVNDKAEISHVPIVQGQHKKKHHVSEMKVTSLGELSPTIKIVA